MNETADRTRVFLVDDHAVVREGVRGLLEDSGRFEVVGAAASAHEALAGITDTQPDLALIDVRLARGDGVELAREVRSRAADTSCLMLTGFEDETAFYQALIAGAKGYVLKDAEPEEIISACVTVAEGGSLMSREALDALRERVYALPEDEQLLADLTPQEQEILNYITEGWTNREIAETMFLAEKTVRNYVSNLLGKLGMKNRTQAAAYLARLIARHDGGDPASVVA